LSKILSAPSRRHFPAKNTACRPKIIVSADGPGLVSQAGALLLTQVLQVTGLERELSAGLQRWQAPRAIHDPGKWWRPSRNPSWAKLVRKSAIRSSRW
jgi:hypothetical protein